MRLCQRAQRSVAPNIQVHKIMFSQQLATYSHWSHNNKAQTFYCLVAPKGAPVVYSVYMSLCWCWHKHVVRYDTVMYSSGYLMWYRTELQVYILTTLYFSPVFTYVRSPVKQGLCSTISKQLYAGVLFVLELLSCLFIMTLAAKAHTMYV